jgi:predicted lactoylglutathione lyase
MLIPTDGFRGITGGRDITPAGSECVLTIGADTTSHVKQLIERAQAAGATSVTAAAQQPWGYTGAFADPDGHVWMVRSNGHVTP